MKKKKISDQYDYPEDSPDVNRSTQMVCNRRKSRWGINGGTINAYAYIDERRGLIMTRKDLIASLSMIDLARKDIKKILLLIDKFGESFFLLTTNEYKELMILDGDALTKKIDRMSIKLLKRKIRN